MTKDKTHAIVNGRKYRVGYPQCAGCENLIITHGTCLYPGEGCEYPEEAVRHPLAFEETAPQTCTTVTVQRKSRGRGRGNWNHKGRPGHVGGSS